MPTRLPCMYFFPQLKAIELPHPFNYQWSLLLCLDHFHLVPLQCRSPGYQCSKPRRWNGTRRRRSRSILCWHVGVRYWQHFRCFRLVHFLPIIRADFPSPATNQLRPDQFDGGVDVYAVYPRFVRHRDRVLDRNDKFSHSTKLPDALTSTPDICLASYLTTFPPPSILLIRRFLVLLCNHLHPRLWHQCCV